MSQWDRFADANQRLHDAFPNPQIQVYNYTESYDPSTGDTTWTQSEDPGSPITGNVVVTEDPVVVEDASGATSEVDAEIWIRDDTGVTITPAGVDDSHPTRITTSEKEYSVFEQHDEQNGLLRLYCVEV